MATHKTFASAFKALRGKIKKTTSVLMKEIAQTGTSYFVDSFNTESFDGTKWQQVQRRIPGTNSYKYPKYKGLGRRTKKILSGTGKLKREVNNSAKEISQRRVVWRVGLPYAARQNEGLSGTPKRKYLGESRQLNRIFKRRIIQAYKKGLS